ncbi:L-histidine N(alpha)-methyltransferase [Teredinibacter turnerae]|uniref:L-histidine N(alpha)-methyltransferase n=1 Tax=Teredinibacter turnerae TaxID=2426 RepID=UPI001E28DE15|nr:L-histidine N(alpha)-methyltransferase [Teredinibacter turnerae]
MSVEATSRIIPQRPAPMAAAANSEFGLAVERGLKADQKAISSRYLYDSRGSALFVEITQLDEYYLSRCEDEIFRDQAHRIVNAIGSEIAEVVELGCGDGFKTERLLQAIHGVQSQLKFVPVDISEDAIQTIEERMTDALPNIRLDSFTGDYDHFLQRNAKPTSGARLVLFLGSNIGNFTHTEASRFVRQIHQYCNSGDYLLLGLDLKKDIDLLHAAYNDNRGVTAEFNFNLLERMNRELGADFDRDKFRHHGYYNAQLGAMQSYLVSTEAQSVAVEALDMVAHFDCLEAIHLEDSHKYSLQDIHRLAAQSGFRVQELFSDSRGYFVDALLQKI